MQYCASVLVGSGYASYRVSSGNQKDFKAELMHFTGSADEAPPPFIAFACEQSILIASADHQELAREIFRSYNNDSDETRYKRSPQ